MTQVKKTPWHLWVVGAVSLLWNSVAASDYVGFKLRSEWYIEATGLSATQLDWLDSYPIWTELGLLMGVWGAFFGAILLLFRSRYAVISFLVSLVGLAITTIYQVGLHSAEYTGLFGKGVLVFLAVIWVIAIALFLYARAQAARGVLR